MKPSKTAICLTKLDNLHNTSEQVVLVRCIQCELTLASEHLNVDYINVTSVLVRTDFIKRNVLPKNQLTI